MTRSHLTGSGARVYRSSSPDAWTMPRPPRMPNTHGPLIPLRNHERWPGHVSRILLAIVLIGFVALLTDDVVTLVCGVLS